HDPESAEVDIDSIRNNGVSSDRCDGSVGHGHVYRGSEAALLIECASFAEDETIHGRRPCPAPIYERIRPVELCARSPMDASVSTRGECHGETVGMCTSRSNAWCTEETSNTYCSMRIRLAASTSGTSAG